MTAIKRKKIPGIDKKRGKTPLDTDGAEQVKALSRDAFITASGDLNIEEVDVPEFGGKVFIRSLTAGGLDAFNYACQMAPDLATASLVVHSVCDKKGTLLFRREDVDLISKRPQAPMTRIALRVLQREGLRDANPINTAEND